MKNLLSQNLNQNRGSALKLTEPFSGRIQTIFREISGKRIGKRAKDGRNSDLGKNPVSEKGTWMNTHLFKLF